MIALLTTRLMLLSLDAWQAVGAAARFTMAEAPPEEPQPGRGVVCPVAPDGAQPLADQMIGWFVWFIVWIAFPAGLLASIAAILVGKFLSMPHVGKGGLIGIFVVLGTALLFLVVPGILAGFIGNGCMRR